MKLLEINEVNDTIKMLGIKKVLEKIKENKGYLWENDFSDKQIIKEEDIDKYISYNVELNKYYKQTIIVQREKTKKNSSAASFTYSVKNISHSGNITFFNGITGVIIK